MKKHLTFATVLFLTAAHFLTLPGFLYAEIGGGGTIKSVQPIKEGGVQITLIAGEKESIYIVTDSTEIKAETFAEKVKTGFRLFFPRSGASGGKGIRSVKSNPLGKLSPGIKKSLGLPNVPELPDVPGTPKLPEKAAMEKPLKPMVKKSKKEGEPQPPPAGMPGGGMQAPAPAEKEKEAEKSEQDRALFGELDADRSLSSGSGKEGPAGLVPKTVTKVEKTSEGIKVQLESSGGEKEEKLLEPQKKVLQQLTPGDLKEQMKIKIEMSGSGNTIKKMTVVS